MRERREGLLVGVRPLNLAEMACRKIVDGARVADGVLSLAADPALAIDTVPVEKVVRVNELHHVKR